MNDNYQPAKESIQIKPGVWIEVSKRMRKASGLGRGVRIRNRLVEEERKRILGSVAHPRKYTRLMLDEASRLADSVGLDAAAQATGIKYWSIIGYRRELRREGKLPKGKSVNNRYTLAQKQQCVRLAHQIADKNQRGMYLAFAEAGRRLGVNGGSISHQWRNQMFQL